MNDTDIKKILQSVLDRINSVENLVKPLTELSTINSEEIKAEIEKEKGEGEPFILSTTVLKQKLKRGRGSRPLLESEILSAQKESMSGFQAAKKLGVCYKTYHKYAVLYNIDTLKNKAGKGIKRKQHLRTGKYPLQDILDGKYPNYPTFYLKTRLVNAGLKIEQCEVCGFKEKRIDGKTPILVMFNDDNHSNCKLENIKFMCYNCCYIQDKIWMQCRDKEGLSNIFTSKQYKKLLKLEKYKNDVSGSINTIPTPPPTPTTDVVVSVDTPT